jgi:hypothetical protein
MKEDSESIIRGISWASLIYSLKGEEDNYIDAIMALRKNDFGSSPGKALVDFLNKWRMRVPSYKYDNLERSIGLTIVNEINKWYLENNQSLQSLPNSLVSHDLECTDTKDLISSVYKPLCRIPHLGDTAAGKILHVLRPNFFVAWDNDIRLHYTNNDSEKTGSSAYLSFLRRMQVFAREITDHSKNIDRVLSDKLVEVIRGNLESQPNGHAKESAKRRLNYLMNYGKPLPKYIDEYNWITITNGIRVPPVWTPLIL